MTLSFNLINKMLKRKNHYAYWLLIVQLVTVLVLSYTISVFGQINSGPNWWKNMDSIEIILVAVIFDMIFAGIMTWQNEKINSAQTWHLLPVSDNNVWLYNILTSLLSCAVAFIGQVIYFGIFELIFSINENNCIFWDSIRDPNVFQFLLFLVLITLLIFGFASFCNMFSKAIVDFLPIKNAKWVRIFVITLLVIIGIYIFFLLSNLLNGFVVRHVLHQNLGRSDFYEPFWLINTICGLFSFLFLALDLWLNQNYFETNVSHY